MSEPPKKKSSQPPRRASGEHPAVIAYRAKVDSIQDTQLEELKQLNVRLARKAALRKDPRRDDDEAPDARREAGSSIPTDVVQVPERIKAPEPIELSDEDFEPDPFPSSKPPKEGER